MNWQNIAILGAAGLGLWYFWPEIQKLLPKTGAPEIPPPQNVPELGGTTQFRHTTVSGPSAPSTSSGFRRARVQGRSAPSVPSAPSGFRRSSVRGAATAGGNCRFTSGSTVCWNNVCTTFNPKSSDASSVSGRQTLCARVRAKYLAQNRGSVGLSYVGMNIGVA